ncbi:unnamed protein product, partial [Porites evermanni]
SSDRNDRLVYRAGSKKGPTFVDSVNTDDVWLVTNRNLYYPLHQDDYRERRRTTGTNPDVCLWQTDITNSDKLIVEDHPKFRGVCVIQLKEGAKRSTRSRGEEKRELIYPKIIDELRSLTWVKPKPFKSQGGMSLISFSMLVHAINVYLNDNYPEAPEDFNFQAELKAASHWHWSDDEKRCLALGPHDDCRVKFAAKQTFDKWVEELDKEREQLFKKSGEDSRSTDEDERVSDLEEGIFSLMMYYNFEMKNESPTTVHWAAKGSTSPKITENAGRQRLGRNAGKKR